MTQWDVFLILGSIVSFVAVFCGVAWRFSGMITKLETLIENLSHTIERMEEEQRSDKLEINQRLDEHDARIRETEIKLTEILVRNKE